MHFHPTYDATNDIQEIYTILRIVVRIAPLGSIEFSLEGRLVLLSEYQAGLLIPFFYVPTPSKYGLGIIFPLE